MCLKPCPLNLLNCFSIITASNAESCNIATKNKQTLLDLTKINEQITNCAAQQYTVKSTYNQQVQQTKLQQYEPTNVLIIFANSATVCSSGLPMLTGRLELPFIKATRPSTRSVTYWKDRVCSPSPYICYIDCTAMQCHVQSQLTYSNSVPVLRYSHNM